MILSLISASLSSIIHYFKDLSIFDLILNYLDNKISKEEKEIDILNKDLFGVKKDVRVNKEKVRYYEKLINDDSDADIKDNIKYR